MFNKSRSHNYGVSMEFFENNQMYVVLVVVLAIWFGFIGYMFSVDRKIKKLEEQIKK